MSFPGCVEEKHLEGGFDLVLISSYSPLVFLFSVFARKRMNNAHNEASSADISILLNFPS